MAELIPHPQTPSPAIRRVDVFLTRLQAAEIQVGYLLHGDLGEVIFPATGVRERRDELWRHTCCELFVRLPARKKYFEFNFSPSGSWAAYEFDDYRSQRRCTQLRDPPDITCERVSGETVALRATILVTPSELATSGPLELAATVVIEHADGSLCYWARTHPVDKPDFHHPDSFAMRLSPLEAP
ncbi:MAG: DOMON-like domain-containing protein [Steroidobacteraceae bacterium]